MKLHPRPLNEQVIVVTGASSGIGLTTAEMAAERGARVLLIARSEDKLRETVRKLRERDLQADYAVADVSKPEELERAAQHAVDVFGRIDTWVNDAAQIIYGPIEEVSIDDARRLFEVNYFGMVNGARAAIPRLKQHGGVLINVGSVVSDRAMPLLGHYSASKHAIKGFTDALRMELEKEGAPIAVTLVKPGSINTPFAQHAKNYLDYDPDYPPTVYEPEVVARAILNAAERPQRDVFAGGAAKMMSAAGQHAPRLTDKFMERSLFEAQQKDERRYERDNLRAPIRGEAPSRHGESQYRVHSTSAYTRLSQSPLAGPLAAFAAAALAVGLWRRTQAHG